MKRNILIGKEIHDGDYWRTIKGHTDISITIFHEYTQLVEKSYNMIKISNSIKSIANT